jgi:REP element-mobilizing transposase RayT
VVIGYVVMPEHIHLLITEPEISNPSKVMQVLKQRTARALLPKRKRKNPRQGSLFADASQPRAFWQARFYDFNVWTTKKRVEKLRYMHRNPLKRGFAGTMAMEQLSFLPSRGNRSSTGECGLDRDFVSWPYSLSRTKPPALSVRNSRPSQTARRTGHPRLLVVLKHQNPGHPPAPISSIKELGALPSVPVFQTVNWL